MAPRASPEGEKADIGLLVDLVARLRAPDGCPWDREQTIDDLRAYLLEEAHEAAAAITSGERGELAGELGDLLFQIVFLAHLGAEEGSFDLKRIIEDIHAKMVARHPHVFGGTASIDTAIDSAAVKANWERRKLAEKGGRESLLAGVPASLPALVAAYRLGQKAAGVGFDWPDARSVAAKVREELAEVEAELAEVESQPAGEPAEGAPHSNAVMEEIGDLLFSVANLARRLEIDPEAALCAANLKFRRRFARVEETFAGRGEDLGAASLERLEIEWQAAKSAEKKEKKRSP